MRCPAYVAAVAAALLCGTGAQAVVVPEKGVADARIRTVEYSPDEVYRLRGIVGYQIDLQFEPGEVFVGLGSGDIDAVSFVGQDNHLFLKPRAARVATNLTVLTSRRHYQIEYTATTGRTAGEDADAMFSVRFSYRIPPARESAGADAELLNSRLQDAADGGRINADYWYCGEPSLRPVAATDNGVHTRLRFSAHAELPAIFVRNADGSESLLNFNVVDGDVIVHRIARQFVVRRGRVTGCIVNAAYTGGGDRLRSGTIAPDVMRDTRGVSP